MSKRNWIRTISIVFIAMLILVGCSSKDSSEGTINDNKGTVANEGSEKQQEQSKDNQTKVIQPDPSKLYSFTWATAGNNNVDENMYQRGWLKDKYNVDISFARIDNATWDEQMGILLATGEIPDLIRKGSTGPADLAVFVDQGVVAETSIDMIKQYMPEYYKYVESFGDPRLWKYGEIDGKHYGLPMPNYMGEYTNAIAWRADWLTNVGINKIPETIKEFEEAFRKFRNEDPNKSGKKDTYGLTGPGKDKNGTKNLFPEIFGAFGTIPFQWLEKNGEVVYGFTQDGTKNALKLLNQWYKEGLIDPEFVTEEGRSQGNDIAWKFSTGKIGYISNLGGGDHQWDGGGHLNGKWLANYPEAKALVFEEGYYDDRTKLKLDLYGITEFNQVPYKGIHPYINGKPPIGPSGASGMPKSGSNNNYIWFGKHMEDDKEKYAKLLILLEKIFTDKETYVVAAIGEEGFTWEWIDGSDGEQYAMWRSEWLSNPDRKELTPKNVGGYAFNPFWVSVKTQYLSAYNVPTYVQRIKTSDNISKFGGYENPVKVALPSISKYADLDSILEVFVVKAILGEVDIDNEYDKVLQTWRSNGGDVLTKEANDWYANLK